MTGCNGWRRSRPAVNFAMIGPQMFNGQSGSAAGTPKVYTQDLRTARDDAERRWISPTEKQPKTKSFIRAVPPKLFKLSLSPCMEISIPTATKLRGLVLKSARGYCRHNNIGLADLCCRDLSSRTLIGHAGVTVSERIPVLAPAHSPSVHLHASSAQKPPDISRPVDSSSRAEQ